MSAGLHESPHGHLLHVTAAHCVGGGPRGSGLGCDHSVHAVASHCSRGHAIHPDALRSQLCGPSAGQPLHRPFGGRVRRAQRVGEMAGGGRDVHHACGGRSTQTGHSVPGDPERPAHIHVDATVERVRIEGFDRSGLARYAHVVDQDVEAAEIAVQSLEHIGHGDVVAHVSDVVGSSPGVHVHGAHPGTGGGQGLGDRCSDSSACARHQRPPPLQRRLGHVGRLGDACQRHVSVMPASR